MPISQPPDDLKPSLAAVLAGSHRGMGTLLLELASRRVLKVEEIKHSRWTGRDYQVELSGEPSGLAPHERSFLELLFKDGARSTRLSESAVRVSGGWPKISAAIGHELRQAGLIDEARSRARRALMAVSGLGLFLGFALFVAGMVLGKGHDAARLGGMLVALGIGAMAIAFIVLILAASLSRLTDRGEALKAQWKSFARYLKEAGQGTGEGIRASEFERFLPYAAAFGLAGTWTKRFQGTGGTLPAWFASLGDDDGGVAFLTFVTASDSGGMSDGGAGSAGASGGGGSGAG